jgi:hypothetical protein
MDPKTLTRAVATLSPQVEKVLQDTEPGETAKSAAHALKSQLASAGGAATPLEEIERAVESVLAGLDAYAKKIKQVEDSGQATFAQTFKDRMPPDLSSREIADLSKRLSDAFLEYAKARA